MSTDNSSPHDSPKGLLRSASVLSLGTLSSRILGFIRDIFLAALLGTTWRADAFFVAFRIPNLLRNMIGEGAVNSALVPVLSEYKEHHDREELGRFVSVMGAWALLILSAVTVLGILGAAWIVRVIAPGFIVESEQFRLTVGLTRMMFPYLVLIGLTAFSMGILYTFRSFWAPAFSPCFLNLALITGAVLATQSEADPVFVLAVAVLIGGLLQLLFQLQPLWGLRLRWRWPVSLSHPGARQTGRLLLPRLLGAGIYQLNILVDTLCASLAMIVGAGGISAIYFANRLIQFPMGVFGLSMISAALPTMAGQANRQDFTGMRQTLLFSMKNIILIMLPSAVALVVLSEPVIRILFQRGAFDAYSTDITSSALLFYALGLMSFGCVRVLAAAFHALQDTMTPAKIAGVAFGVNVVMNFILMFPLKIAGIALASSIAATLNFLLLLRLMDRRLENLSGPLAGYSLRVLASALVMGAVLRAGWTQLTGLPGIARLLVCAITGILVFGGTARLLDVEQFRQLQQWIFRKK